jgi:hypothetical protein
VTWPTGIGNYSFLQGATVTRLFVDQYAVGFLLDSPVHGIFEWRIEVPFTFVRNGDAETFEPEAPTTMSPLLASVGRTVVAAALEDDALHVQLSDGIESEMLAT